jgi:preprotein translocase subunit SecE
VARQTRQQRRARRQQRDGSAPAAKQQPKPASTPRAQQVRPAQTPAKQQTGRREAAPPRGRFLRESWAELKKVDWPSRTQVIQGTIVVIIACAIVGAYLYIADQVFRRVVEVLIG